MFYKIRQSIAAFICPEMRQDQKFAYDFLITLIDVHTSFTDIEEVKDMAEWVIGRVLFYNDYVNVEDHISKKTYPVVYKYPSLSHFRDIMYAEYRRKMTKQ